MGDHSDEEGGMDMGGIQTMGIIHAMKTGDVHLDMLVAMLIPIILRMLFRSVERFDNVFLRWWKALWIQAKTETYERTIVHRTTRTSWGSTNNLDDDTQNTILIKAIQLYLHHNCHLDMRTASVDLTALQTKKRYSYYDHDDDEDKTAAGRLRKYKIVQKPPKNLWHDVGEYGKPAARVQLLMEEQEEDSDKESSSRRLTLTLRLTSTSETAIDAFIHKAYQWYMDELRSMEDNSRHIYELKTSSSSDDDGGSGANSVYKRFKLSDEKTFDSLFFRQKEALLKILGHFQDRTGKYAIKGYPHKLGLLLHGPPGTGKTSLIKALAQHTGRSIVNVSLSKISTNSELMSVFFDQKYVVEGEDLPIKQSFKDVIYVMEDVDAASKVVKRRDGKVGCASNIFGSAGDDSSSSSSSSSNDDQESVENVPLPKSLWRMMLESNDGECQQLVQTLMEKNPRLKEAATKPEVLIALSNRMALPGLGFVGQAASSEALAKVSDDAIGWANSLMNNFSTIDRFIGTHAKSMKTLLESGAAVNDEFVDRLLGVAPKQQHQQQSNHQQQHQQHQQSGDGWSKDGEGGGGQSEMGQMVGFGPADYKSSGTSSLFKPAKDQLNLSGLLNVLDGVVDTPGRILIMTTNHPEMLDPALIRPGRIDKKILLGYMAAEDVVAMLRHYFQTTLTPDQIQRVEKAFDRASSPLRLTPAQVEQMTAEYEDLDDMIEALGEPSSIQI